MFRLTREVRFAINDLADEQLQHAPANGFGGYPALTGFGQFFAVQVTLEGKLNRKSCYLRNIKDIDGVVRNRVIPALHLHREGLWHPTVRVALAGISTMLFIELEGAWSPDQLAALTLVLTPFLSITNKRSELGMQTLLNQKFEFSAAHRLHNPALSDDENRKTYGKCNNPNWHGHNYEVQVTLRGSPNQSGLLASIPTFERIVHEFAITKLDHKNLNTEVPEFAETIPTVENIAMVIYRMLKNRFTGIGADLASITVWETPKTWCEYSE